jgi:hypothetical protein
VGFVAASNLGCANFGPGLRGTPCPVEWMPTESIALDAANLRARVEMRIRSEEVHLEVISERHPEELIVVGLARFGVRLFAVHQRGTEVRVEGASNPDLERVALWVMDALHRAYWIAPPEAYGTEFEWSWGGEHVRETVINDSPRREFSVGRVAAPDDATQRVSIDYARSTLAPTKGSEPESTTGPASVSESESFLRAVRVSIENPFCGYTATIAPIRSR